MVVLFQTRTGRRRQNVWYNVVVRQRELRTVGVGGETRAVIFRPERGPVDFGRGQCRRGTVVVSVDTWKSDTCPSQADGTGSVYAGKSGQAVLNNWGK